MKKLLKPIYILSAAVFILYYFFMANLVFNDSSKFYGVFAYFLFFLPIIFILGIVFLNFDKIDGGASEVIEKLEEKIEPLPHPVLASNPEIEKEFDIPISVEDDLKHEFLAIISHEIRTVMTGVVSIPDLLNEKKVTKKEKEEIINLLSYSSKELMVLVNDLLDFSKIEAGKIELHDSLFNPRDTIQHKIDFLKLTTKNEANVEIKFESLVDDNSMFMGDSHKIGQMVSNLIINALKFTLAGEIFIQIKEKEFDQNSNVSTLEFSVEDTGIGIDEEGLKHIFEPYEQIKNSQKLNGTGLGLAILKYYANLMGGDATAESVVGQGTAIKFTVKLLKSSLKEKAVDNVEVQPTEGQNSETLSEADAAMMAAMMEDQPKEIVNEEDATVIELKNNAYILIAEDNKGNQKFLELLLTKMGLKFKFADDGKEAFDIFTHDYCYDLVLMDTSLPEMDGVEVVKKIREWEKKYEKKPIPIIAITANGSSSHLAECKEIGMNGIISKPINIAQVKEQLSKYVVIDK